MAESRKVLFIINKFSGGGYKPSVEGKIIALCGRLNIECSIEFTQGRGHASELAKEASEKGFDTVFAVGGDGTVNEVAQGLVYTNTPMGIIPKGSGNGLARHLGIPMGFLNSLSLIESTKVILMDTFLVNGKLSVNVSGIGFDGHVASMFGKDGKRGFLSYSKLVLKEFKSFKEFDSSVFIDGEEFDRKAFMISMANSSQFGNNAKVAPQASVCDQLIDVSIIKKISFLESVGFGYQMFTGQLDRSPFVEIKQTQHLQLKLAQPVAYHIDGEGMKPTKDFTISMQAASLRMVIPQRKKKV
jgi:YegS/Rv2252/BmrU family lipid kinase